MQGKLNSDSGGGISPVFLMLFAVFLSLAWVIPNHTRPWGTFYSDAIVGVVLLILAFWIFYRSPGKLELIDIGIFFILLSLIPWLQFATGIVYSFGTAWINFFYLMGFSLAILLGWQWEKITPGQCLDFLFLSMCCAGSVSVALQLCQWFHVTADPWIMIPGPSRFYANIGQPNLLASLLILASLGVAWAYSRKTLPPSIAIFLVLYFLLGVVLTESRTAWLNVFGALIALHLFWQEGRPKYFGKALLIFGGYFFAFHLSLPWINDWLFGTATTLREAADPIRLNLWKNLALAVLERPMFGYGWGQTDEAAFAATSLIGIGGVFKHAHNLILDVFLYNGILIGALFVFVFYKVFRHFFAYLKHGNFVIPCLALAVLLVHGMLEFPLHYAFFLLPFGMILGVLAHASKLQIRVFVPKWGVLLFSIAMACGLWVTIIDCLEAERTYFGVYYGKKGKQIPSDEMPKASLLTQWEERLKFANSMPEVPLSPEKYRWMKGVVVSTPEAFLLFGLAQNLALNGRPDEAKLWLDNMCKITAKPFADKLVEQWAEEAEKNPIYRTVDWRDCHAVNRLN